MAYDVQKMKPYKGLLTIKVNARRGLFLHGKAKLVVLG